MKQLVTNIYLKNTRLKLLENWSVQYLLESKFSYNDNFELVPIGSFLIKSRLKTLIEDEKTYQRVTVKINNNGVFPRDTEIGKNIGTKQQYLVKTGQFLMSKIDARNGAFGLVPENLEGAIVTNDFPVFDVDKTVINPEFLVLITTTKEFIKFAQSCSSGTTNRQRIDVDLFLNVKIPLPSIPEQNRIVKSYNAKIRLAEEQEQAALELEKEIEEYLSKTLEIKEEISNYNTFNLIKMISFKDTSRWDINFFFNDKIKLSSKYQFTTYGELFYSLKNGISARDYAKKGIRFLKVADIKENSISNNHIYFIDRYLEKDLIEKGTLLITRKGTVGQSYFVSEDKKFTASSEVFIIRLNNQIDGNYIAEINLADFVKKQYIEKSTGTIMPSLSQEKLKNIQIPLPPIEMQKEIASKVNGIKVEIKELRLEVLKNRKLAIKEFENEIFTS